MEGYGADRQFQLLTKNKNKMNGFDPKKLNQLKKDLAQKSSGNIIYASKINGSMELRFLPPHEDMDGSPYFERESWNVGKEVVTSPSTFGEYDVIEEEVVAAKAYIEQLNKSRNKEDKEYAKDLAQLINDWQHCKKKTDYLIPCLPVNDDGVEITFGDPKIFSCGLTAVQDYMTFVSDRKYMNGTPYGVADRVRGRNFTVEKTGVKKETKYSIKPWPNEMEVPIEFFKPGPNPVEYVRKGLQNNDYLRSLIRNYLYGEELLPKSSAASEDDEPEVIEKSTPVPQRSAPQPKSTPTTQRRVPSPSVKSQGDEAADGNIQPDQSFDQSPTGTPVRVPSRGATGENNKVTPPPTRRNILNDIKKS